MFQSHGLRWLQEYNRKCTQNPLFPQENGGEAQVLDILQSFHCVRRARFVHQIFVKTDVYSHTKLNPRSHPGYVRWESGLIWCLHIKADALNNSCTLGQVLCEERYHDVRKTQPPIHVGCIEIKEKKTWDSLKLFHPSLSSAQKAHTLYPSCICER